MPVNKEQSKNKDRRRTRSLFITELSSIIEVHDDETIAMHLINILRSKGKIVGSNPDGTPIYRDPFFITDAELLKDTENYSQQKNSIDEEEE